MTELLIRLFVKNYRDTDDKAVRENYGTLGSGVGIACNIILCTVKIAIGLITGSMSVIADGLNNLSDMGSSVITMIGFKLSGKPADRDHPFGHGRMEYMSAFIVSILIIIVGVELCISSVKALIAGESAPVYDTVALVVLALSVAFKLWMYIFNRKLGNTISSGALLATAQDSVNDSIATAAILAAAIVSSLVSLPFNLDAVMATGVGLFIIWSGITSAKDTLDEILGGPPEKELIDQLEKEILSFEDFLGIHDLIVHNYGPGRQFASVHVEVPQDIDIVECHERIDICEKLVSEKVGISLVIHMDPIDVNNEEVANTRSMIGEAVKEIDSRITIHDFRMTPFAKERTNLIFDAVIPSDVKLTKSELDERIGQIARNINPTYVCVITYDDDYTGA